MSNNMGVPKRLDVGWEETTLPLRGGRTIIMELCRLALIALPILVSGAAAMASEDVKIYPGAMCQPEFSTDEVSRDRNDGRMVNESDSNQIRICPVVRDEEAADGVEFAAITVLGRTSTSSPARSTP